ncbi:MAG: hypothetical protein DMG16_20150 [Acidobacteria bacterium]|nr:MAG: hypothetical protein DMG16_20150 [Acidobacteriota bacterium]
MTKHTISKSRFKSHALEYFQQVEQSRKRLIITHRGKPVLKVVPFSEGSGYRMFRHIDDGSHRIVVATQRAGWKDRLCRDKDDTIVAP